jgi:alkylated DNA repair dioxygenase AlkB
MAQVYLDDGVNKFWGIDNFCIELLPYLEQIKFLNHPPITVYGKHSNQNRNIAFFSDESEGYRYSNQIIKSTPLDDSPKYGDINLLKWLLETVNKTLDTSFNGMLINEYENGTDYIGAHGDNETALSKGKVACISFGATRTFRIRNKATKQILFDLPNKSGMLTVMDGINFQRLYTHEIPVQKKIKDKRISVTFRHHLQ